MNTKLSKVKVNQVYNFHIADVGEFGGWSRRCWVMGQVKEIKGEFIKIIPTSIIKTGNKRSIKIYNNTIIQISK